MSAQENLLLPHYGRLRSAFGLRSARCESSQFTKTSERLQLHPNDPKLAAGSFSGGNAQKLVVGRWLTGLDDTKVIVLDEPTQGVDIGSRRKIYALLREYAAQPGRCVVFTSSDPDEVVALADRGVCYTIG